MTSSEILFRYRKELDEAPWLRGSEEHIHLARRNPTGKAALSAILARALLAATTGQVKEIWLASTDGEAAIVVHSKSKSTGLMAQSVWAQATPPQAFIPNGGEDKVTYYLGLLALAEALIEPERSVDLLNAYADYLAALARATGKAQEAKPQFLRLADELYYWLRYRDGDPDPANDRLAALVVKDGNVVSGPELDRQPPNVVSALIIESTMRSLITTPSGPSPAKRKSKKNASPLDTFVGPQAGWLMEAVQCGENALLAGPTGTGKTFAVGLIARALGWRVETVEGKEGLIDLDFLGAYIPAEDDARKRLWKDGPVTRAMRLAQSDPVLLFLDEGNRTPRHHLNMLLGMMNEKDVHWCWSNGLDDAPEGDGPFYALEIPMKSEALWCPVRNLRIVMAGNFGKEYATYELDPAVRRRFPTVIEFDYPPAEQEKTLLISRAGVSAALANYLVQAAVETRRRHRNGTLPGALDTASLLNWAQKCARIEKEGRALTVSEVMGLAARTWADLVCGREHTGQLKRAEFDALGDYLVSIKMPPGGWSAKPVQD